MLSIVATLYCSAPYIEEFVARSAAAAALLGTPFEIVLVNDGSPDDSLRLARTIADRNPSVRVIDLAKNFGHHRAMMIGLMHCTGDFVFLIDADLEEPPELLAEFWRRLHDSPDVDVVYGQLERRKGGWFEKVSGEAFYSAINWLGGVTVPRNISTARLMTRRYVDALTQYREREIFMAGLWATTGFRQVPLLFSKGHKGETTYSLRRKLSLLVNSVTAFSNRPLRLIFYTGVAIFLISSFFAMYLMYMRLYTSSPPSGWASLIVSVWLLGGLIILFLGIIGIYLAKIFIEVKQRPYSTIREIYTGRADAE
jgi:putative glycosyltransferase